MACDDVCWRLELTQEGLRLDDTCGYVRSDWDTGAVAQRRRCKRYLDEDDGTVGDVREMNMA